MKRDMDLIRDLLLAAEAMPADHQYFGNEIAPAGVAGDIVAGHLQLLIEADLLKGKFTQYLSGEFSPENALIIGIPWAGHELIDTIRSETVWSRTKERLASVGGTVSIEILKTVAKSVTKDLLGLP